MKGDFSRETFDASKHFSGVRLQQGRVQLDADWNEQLDIADHRIRAEITDFIGQSGTPDGNAGFAITVVARGPSASNLMVGRGRYYVDGLLFENENDISFDGQPDFPGAALPTTDGTYLAYLDVWQRDITSVEDPRLLEPALGGADTSTRVRNIAQVKLQLLAASDSKEPKDYLPPFQPHWERPIGTGTLAARVSAPRATLENQLYRVEIHRGGGVGTATFKWSRDNGSVAARVKAIDGETIVLQPGVREAQTVFATNQWLELTDDEHVLTGEPGILVEIARVQGDDVTIVAWPNRTAPTIGTNAIVRRWDSQPGDTLIRAGQLPVEQDIEVSFDTSANARYKTGDYWWIPARSLSESIEWPRNADQSPLAVGPRGVRHRYAALALLTVSKERWTVVADVRARFRPIGSGLVNKAGDTITGTLSVLGSVGIGTLTPRAALHVQADSTVPTPGGAPLLQVTDSSGAAQFAVGRTGDVDTRGKLVVADVEARGRISVATATNSLSVPGASEDLRIVRGNVRPVGTDRAQLVTGGGCVVAKVTVANVPSPGLFDITFAPAFSGRPSASVTIVHQDDFVVVDGERPQEFDNVKGNPSRNAIIIAMNAQRMRVKTGDERGNAIDLAFSFVAMGPR